MELKPIDILKMFQKTHENEPHEEKVADASPVVETSAGPAEESYHEFRATQHGFSFDRARINKLEGLLACAIKIGDKAEEERIRAELVQLASQVE